MTFSPYLIATPLASAIVLICSSNAWAEVQQLDTLVMQAQPFAQIQLDPFGQSVFEIAHSVNSIDAKQIAAQGLQNLSDLASQDASLGEGYMPIGYYGNIVSRGFALDSANGYLLNGQTVRGEQNIALENKQRVEVLKGVASLYSPMATPGGVVNYVTKRPEDVRSVSMHANQYGQIGAHVDVGGFSTSQDLGYRFNLATEKLKPYIKAADGERYFAALALDYQFNPQQKLEIDAEWQRQSQYSVAGYQLFNGNLPQGIEWERALGQQAWSKPVKNDSLSTQLQYQQQHGNWDSTITASYSQVVIDDYSSFPWGCYSEICQIEGLGNQFDQTGHYDVYDFQSPNDTRRTLQLGAALTGELNSDRLEQRLHLAWKSTQKRQQQHEPINAWVGVGNAMQQNVPLAQADAELGAYYTALKSQQHSLSIQDQLRWHPAWSAMLGGQWLSVDEQAYSADGQAQRDTQLQRFLPQLALMYQPTPDAQAYLSYREGLSDGAVAPWYAENALMSLAPRQSKQYELGFKQLLDDWEWNVAIFDLSQDYQYAKALQDGFRFVSEGQQNSRGLELGVQGKVSPAFSINANSTWLDSKVEGAQGFGKQMQNVPRLRAVLQAHYQVAQIDGLSVAGELRYSASKFANKAATIKAASYTVFDLSAAYDFAWQDYPVTVNMQLDNVFNKQYWRDVGDYMGDDYLFLGQPRTFKIATTLQF